MGLEEEYGYESSINYITNELLQAYDQKFNNSYKKIVNINSSIMNKEELIYKENDEIQYKDNVIRILQYTIVLIIVFGGLLMMYGSKKINLFKLILFSIILFIIYLLFIYFKMYSDFSLSNIDKYFKNLKVDMVAFYDTNIESKSGYKCPVNCPPNPSFYIGETKNIKILNQPTLNIDPQTNVWQYGDIPTDLYTTPSRPGDDFYINPRGIPNYGPNAENEPQPFFGTTYPATTYYECEWLGGNIKGQGLPNNEKNQYTTIPCSFRPNFQEVGRYICNSDPNTSGIDGNCDTVTN
jgi:hypothetical protein